MGSAGDDDDPRHPFSDRSGAAGGPHPRLFAPARRGGRGHRRVAGPPAHGGHTAQRGVPRPCRSGVADSGSGRGGRGRWRPNDRRRGPACERARCAAWPGSSDRARVVGTAGKRVCRNLPAGRPDRGSGLSLAERGPDGTGAGGDRARGRAWLRAWQSGRDPACVAGDADPTRRAGDRLGGASGVLPAAGGHRADPAGDLRPGGGAADHACGAGRLLHHLRAPDGRSSRGARGLGRPGAQLRPRALGGPCAGPSPCGDSLSGRGASDRGPGSLSGGNGRRVHGGRARHGRACHTGDAQPRRDGDLGAGHDGGGRLRRGLCDDRGTRGADAGRSSAADPCAAAAPANGAIGCAGRALAWHRGPDRSDW